MKRLPIGFLILIFPVLQVPAQEAHNVKALDAWQCRLVLPDDSYTWFDGSRIPGVLAAYQEDTGAKVLLLVMDVPEDVALNEAFLRGFERAMTESGDMKKISGEYGTFRDVPCYDLHVRVQQNNSIATTRLFLANGRLYQLQVIGSDLPLAERNQLELLYTAFEFIGTPVLPKATATRGGSSDSRGYRIGYAMGQLTAVLLLVAVGIVAFRFLFRRRAA